MSASGDFFSQQFFDVSRVTFHMARNVFHDMKPQPFHSFSGWSKIIYLSPNFIILKCYSNTKESEEQFTSKKSQIVNF